MWTLGVQQRRGSWYRLPCAEVRRHALDHNPNPFQATEFQRANSGQTPRLGKGHNA